MRKLLAIIWKENYLRFTDRTGAIFMFITPLVLSAIMGLAFSDLSGPSDVPALDIPVGIVNLDEGSDRGTLGNRYQEIMIPPTEEGSTVDNDDPVEIASAEDDNPLFEMFDTRTFDNEAEARALVENGELTAIVVIPPDFSASLMPDLRSFMGLGSASNESDRLAGFTEVNIYYNGRSQINWAIFLDAVQRITNGIANGNIAPTTTVMGLIAEDPSYRPQVMSGELDDMLMEIGIQASEPSANPIRITRQDLSGETVDDGFDPLSFFSPGFAIFFMGFTVTLGTASILQEQHDWTLQRMVTTPTAKSIILAGKMLGTYVGGILQMIVLITAMSLVGLVLGGPGTVIWGEDILGVALITVTAVAAASGVGAAIAAFAKNAEQAGNLGSFIQFVMGLAGGVFFPTLAMPEALQFVPRLTFHFWGVNGYQQLAAGGTVIDILPNVLALLALAVLFYVIGLWQFRRRLDI